MILQYIQFALGSIRDLPEELKKGYSYQVARTFDVGRKYFLEETAGLKQLAKIPSVIEAGLEWREITIVSPRINALFNTCKAAKELIGATEIYTNLKGIFEPQQSRLAKVADWVITGCDTYEWLSTIGFVATRILLLKRISALASMVCIANGVWTEGAKWWTGKIVDPLTGNEKKIQGIDKVKSVMSCIIILGESGLTMIAVAQIVGYTVASVTFLNFACTGTVFVCTIASHFWEELIIVDT